MSRLGHEVAVFSRIEDPYQPDFNITTEKDNFDQLIQLFLVNHARSRDRYRHSGMDKAFDNVSANFEPRNNSHQPFKSSFDWNHRHRILLRNSCCFYAS